MLPSIKTLSKAFPPDVARQARKVLEMSHAELSVHPVGSSRISECYHHPKWYDVRMTILNSVCGTYGVEGFQDSKGNWLTYLNNGDTYTPTILYWKGKYIVSTWGDIVEQEERRGNVFA